MRKFNSDQLSSNNLTDEVPWHNTYNSNKDFIGQEHTAKKIIETNSGLLILCDPFKSFVFRGKKLFNLMLNVLDYYVENLDNCLLIIVQVTSNRVPDFGVDESNESNYKWVKENNKYIWVPMGYDPDLDLTNPFMPRTSAVNEKKSKGRVRGSGGRKPSENAS